MPPVGSLALVLGLLAGGMIVSLIADRRDARPGQGPTAGTPQARLTPDEDPHLRHD
jgi:hypothetical protein